ncbi:hypothetical protein SmJEL517_g01858, partial [Synchytrium microbalum]
MAAAANAARAVKAVELGSFPSYTIDGVLPWSSWLTKFDKIYNTRRPLNDPQDRVKLATITNYLHPQVVRTQSSGDMRGTFETCTQSSQLREIDANQAPNDEQLRSRFYTGLNGISSGCSSASSLVCTSSTDGSGALKRASGSGWSRLLDAVAGVAGEAETSLATRRETHRQNGVKAAFIIRQHVAQSISSQLPITWSAYAMMQHLTTQYGGSTAVNLVVKWEEHTNFSTLPSDTPTSIISNIKKIQKDIDDICDAKGITIRAQFTKVMSNLLLLKVLDTPVYGVLRQLLLSAYNAQMAANNSRTSDNINVYKKPDTNRNTRTFKSPATLVCFRCWDMGHSSSRSGCENAVRAFPGFSDQAKDPNIGHKNVAVCVQCWKSGHRKSECIGTSRPFPGIIQVTGAATISRNESSNWLLDGGASHHMTGDASCLVDGRPINNRVFGIGNTSLKVTGIGRVIGR